MYKRVCCVLLLLVSFPSFACQKNCQLVADCDNFHYGAVNLVKSQKLLSFCRAEFSNAEQRLGEACVALGFGRVGHAKENIRQAADYLRNADKAKCKHESQIEQLRSSILNFHNTF